MNYPSFVSFTLTNRCNLRCRMCGQWSAEGYMHGRLDPYADELRLDDWKRLGDEVAAHGIKSILLRGGETFMFPGIIDLIEHLVGLGLFVPIDTNGTLIGRYADELVRIGGVHLTISVDGPEAVHDEVRGVPGSFRRVREGLRELAAAEARAGKKISRSANFTISPYSLPGFGDFPAAARELGLGGVCAVPYYFTPEAVGKRYEREVAEAFGQPAPSWRGFHHENSGVDPEEFSTQYRRFRVSLGDLLNYPYMPLTEDQYRLWFADATTEVEDGRCSNAENLIDIQPNGDANSCVDYCDVRFGNVRTSTIGAVWNSDVALRFREYRRTKAMAVCARCGARHMGEFRNEDGTLRE